MQQLSNKYHLMALLAQLLNWQLDDDSFQYAKFIMRKGYTFKVPWTNQ